MSDNRTFYNEVVLEHANYPAHKFKMIDPTNALRGVNPTCGDDITLQLKISEDGVVEDGSYIGDGCAISRASADMMLDLIIGKKVEDALALKDLFLKMIKDRKELSEEELEEMKEEQLSRGIKSFKYNRHCLNLTEEEKQKYLERTTIINVTIPKVVGIYDKERAKKVKKRTKKENN